MASTFSCKFCSFTSTRIQDKLAHRIQHPNVGSKYHCDLNECPRVDTSEANFRSHLLRDHGLSATDSTTTTLLPASCALPQYKCSVSTCQKVFPHYGELRKHLNHHFESLDLVPCIFPLCEKVYQCSTSFRSHLARSHKTLQVLALESDLVCLDSCVGPLEPECVESRDNSNLLNAEVPQVSENWFQPSTEVNNQLTDALGTFYLTLEAKHLVPSSTVQTIVSGVNDLSILSIESQKQKLNNLLKNKLKDEFTVDSIVENFFGDSSLFLNQESLSTSYLRKKFYHEKFSYVDPLKIIYSGNPDDKPPFFYYVPIKETIKAMFQDGTFRNAAETTPIYDPNYLRDFQDGTRYRNCELFSDDPDALSIILFQDAFGITNPLAPTTAKSHKVLGVYMVVGNTPSYWRSHIGNIQLVCLCKEKDYQHSEFYKKLIEDLKDIEENGIEVLPNKILRGTVVFILGDNLGSHGLGGYLESFATTKFFCRYCLIERHDFVCSCLSAAVRRTEENYNHALEHAAETDQSDYQGIKFDSIFNLLNFYHVTLGLPPCLAHDLFEGVVGFDLALFIKRLVILKWFTIQWLNEKMKKFKYASEDVRDKPVPLNDKCVKIGGSASQVSTFIKLLPLFVEDKIKDPDEKAWQGILLLREVCLLVTSPVIHRKSLSYIEAVISEYITLRSEEAFDLVKLRPKHHYLTHYPELMQEFGPFVKVWTLRFESKHSFFKEVARLCKNYINVLKTLSEKHELNQALQRAGSNFRPEVFCSSQCNFDSSSTAADVSMITNLPISKCNEITVKGTFYKTGYVVVLSQGQFVLDLDFGLIRNILIDRNQLVFLIVEKMNSVYNPIIQTYNLQYSQELSCVQLSKLADYLPLPLYHVGSQPCVILKHAVLVFGH